MNRTTSAVLAGTLGTVLSLSPSFAQNAPIQPVSQQRPQQDVSEIVRKIRSISETYPGVVIAVSKGQKEKLLTAEQVGEKLVQVFKNSYEVPARYETEMGSDYTTIIFAVKGHLYGPYGLKESLIGMGVAADNYNSKVFQGVFPKITMADMTAKSEP